MRKFYITFGDFQCMMGHNDMWQACKKVFIAWLDAGYRDNMPRYFRVSERGFDEHDDDLKVCIDEVLAEDMHDAKMEAWIQREVGAKILRKD